MKKIKYYLDTTIFNFVFAECDTAKKDITVKLFKDLPSIANGIYISDEVIREISRAPEPRKSQLTRQLEEANPLLLAVDIDAEELAERYVEKESFLNDIEVLQYILPLP